jgi:hypothetical protein
MTRFKAAHWTLDDGMGLQKWWTPAAEKPISIAFYLDFTVRRSA